MSERMSLIRVPTSADEFLPPKPSDLITESASLLRDHWDELQPFWAAISGEAPSRHGRLWLDEAELTFEVQKIVRSNGFNALADAPSWKLWHALRRAYKRNTGIAVHQLEKQRLRLQYHPEAYDQGDPEGEAAAAAEPAE